MEPPPNFFSRSIAYVIARICMFFRPICTITDGETDAAVEMIQAPSRMEKRIYQRFHASRTGQRTQKAPVETTLKSYSPASFVATTLLRAYQGRSTNIARISFIVKEEQSVSPEDTICEECAKAHYDKIPHQNVFFERAVNISLTILYNFKDSRSNNSVV
jgi:hypothetical protein